MPCVTNRPYDWSSLLGTMSLWPICTFRWSTFRSISHVTPKPPPQSLFPHVPDHCKLLEPGSMCDCQLWHLHVLRRRHVGLPKTYNTNLRMRPPPPKNIPAARTSARRCLGLAASGIEPCMVVAPLDPHLSPDPTLHHENYKDYIQVVRPGLEVDWWIHWTSIHGNYVTPSDRK
jgi:hypothetical protein